MKGGAGGVRSGKVMGGQVRKGKGGERRGGGTGLKWKTHEEEMVEGIGRGSEGKKVRGKK